MAGYYVTSSYGELLVRGTANVIVSSAQTEILHKGDAAVIVSSAHVSVLRTVADKTDREYASIVKAYAVLRAVVDDQAKTSALASFAVMRQEPVTSASTILGYAVLRSSEMLTPKITSYAVLRIPQAVSKIKGYVVLKRTARTRKPFFTWFFS